MRLRERQLVHVCHQTHLMLVAQGFKTHGKTAATPHELEVRHALVVRESFKDSPETFDDGVVGAIVGECRDGLQTLD